MVLARSSASAVCDVADPATAPAVYRPRRPAVTVLHRTVRENLETFLVQARQAAFSDPATGPVRPAVERALREYLRCGIPAYGFARVKCTACEQEFILSFSCKGFDLCPSCGTRRMVETAAHLVDVVLPRVPFRQWVLSMPKRVRWFLKHEPKVVDGILRVFLRAVETAARRASRGAPREARFGAVAFVRRFGSYFNVNG